MDVVKEPLDVEEKHGANQLLFDGELCRVNDSEGGINRAVMRAGAKLMRGEDRVQARIVKNT